VDDDIGTLIEQLAKGDAAIREDLTRSLSCPQVDVLIAFAVRMAMLGVREQSVSRLRVGLLAVALGGSSRAADWRDVATHMPPLEDAGERIHDDPRPAFLEAASIASGYTASQIRIASPPTHTAFQWLKRMRPRRLGQWRVIEAPDGFRYVVANPVSESELMAMFDKALSQSRTKQ
jgi:hypothetical protein